MSKIDKKKVMKEQAPQLAALIEKMPFEVFEAEYKNLRRIMVLKRMIERARERIKKAEESIESANLEIGELKASLIDWKAA